VTQYCKRKADRCAIRESRQRVRNAALILELNHSGSENEELDENCENNINDDCGNFSDASALVDDDVNQELEHMEYEHSQENNIVNDDEDDNQQEKGNESVNDNIVNDDLDDDSEEEELEEEEEDENPDAHAGVGNNQLCAAVQIENPQQYVLQQLRDWTLAGGVSMRKVDDLLRRLKPVHPQLPLTYKTLLQTPKSIDVVDCVNGSLWYCGIAPQLYRNLSPDYFLSHNDIVIDVNIDSLPIFNKSNTNFIPILGRLVDCVEPFIIGIFCGDGSDPKDMDSFFENYVEEVNNLTSNGFFYEDETFDFQTRNYILDQKARAKVKCVKGVRGYFCCEKCTVRGVDHANRMCLLDHNCPLRTDESFIKLAAALMGPRGEHYDDDDNTDEHVIGLSPLLQCETKLVSKFRLDSMHLVYKGTFLRWFDFLWNGRGDYSLSPVERRDISALIGSFRS
jgi:hypothetical protein